MRALLVATAAALACAAGAHAHEGGPHTGFVATVSLIDPPQIGLLVRVLGGHERLSVQNLTQGRVVIFGEDGQAVLRLAPGESGSVADSRIGSTGPPPDEGEFVKDWRIAGEADGERFEIVGFLGYRPPPGAEPAAEKGGGLPVWAIALVSVVGAAVVAPAIALPLRRREGDG